jgi:hypothetical protein
MLGQAADTFTNCINTLQATASAAGFDAGGSLAPTMSSGGLVYVGAPIVEIVRQIRGDADAALIKDVTKPVSLRLGPCTGTVALLKAMSPAELAPKVVAQKAQLARLVPKGDGSVVATAATPSKGAVVAITVLGLAAAGIGGWYAFKS